MGSGHPSRCPCRPPAPSFAPISLPEEARETLFDGFWRAAYERLRQREGLPPAPRSDCFPRPWFEHGYKLNHVTADL